MKAFVTYLSTDNYYKGVLVLKKSLDKCNSKYPLYCMVTKNIGEDVVTCLKQFGISIIKIDDLNIREDIKGSVKDENFAHWNNCWDKLNVFNLLQFEKVVYLDGDMIVYRNIDELFDCENLTASTDGVWIFGKERERFLNAGLMVIDPNEKTFRDLIVYINSLREGFLQDQLILQSYFSKWGDETNLHLSEAYNMWVPYADYYPQEIQNSIKVLHYIGKIKPFMSYDFVYGSENCKQYYQLYFDYLKELNLLDV